MGSIIQYICKTNKTQQLPSNRFFYKYIAFKAYFYFTSKLFEVATAVYRLK